MRRTVPVLRRLFRNAAPFAAAAHLAFVVAGAMRLSFPGRSVAAKAFAVYGAYSGANNSYGYFAPGVAAEWRAALDIYDARTGAWTTRTRAAPNLELAVLDSTINSNFSRKDVREALAASWAASELPQAPGAAAVVVRAEAFLLPTLAQYRSGARGAWRTLAAYAFTTEEREALAGAQGPRASSR
ncbi:MAG TPA: hypothetical protein VFA79_12495 [Myxococcales bacterium]|nr:hypothetical protein [Myxococcales bacterium]